MTFTNFQDSLFNEIIPALRSKNITLTTLRDLDTIENVIKSGLGDVDLYISEKDWKISSETIRAHGFFNLFENQIFMSTEHNNVIDLYHGFYKRAPFISDSELSEGQLLDCNFLQLPQHLLLAILLLHPLDLTGIRGNRNYSEVRKSTIQKLYDIDDVRNKFLEWCRLSIGVRFAKHAERLATNNYQYTQLFLLRMKLVLFLEKPSMLGYFFNRVAAKFLPSHHMKGRVISVMGVDGSGKTTLLNELSAFLVSYMGGSGKIQYSYMGRQAGHRLPLELFSRLLRRIRRKPRQIEEPGSCSRNLSKEGEAAKTFSRPIWRFIFPIEYSIRLAEIWYLVLFRRKIVLTDRYVDDFIQDDSVGFVLRFIVKLFPKPSHVLLITGDVAKFFERKNEYSPEELKVMQEKLLTRLCSAYGDRLMILDGNQPISAVLDQALAALHSS